jgi:hypothetical protein
MTTTKQNRGFPGLEAITCVGKFFEMFDDTSLPKYRAITDGFLPGWRKVDDAAHLSILVMALGSKRLYLEFQLPIMRLFLERAPESLLKHDMVKIVEMLNDICENPKASFPEAKVEGWSGAASRMATAYMFLTEANERLGKLTSRPDHAEASRTIRYFGALVTIVAGWDEMPNHHVLGLSSAILQEEAMAFDPPDILRAMQSARDSVIDEEVADSAASLFTHVYGGTKGDA